MTTAREDIIGSIRRHLAASKPFDAVHREHAGGQAEAVVNIALPAENLADVGTPLDNFGSSASLLGIHFEVAANVREAAALVESVINRIGAKDIAISDSELVAESIETIETVEFTRDASTEFLFGSDLGITSAQWAIAETGTLVLEAESENHRLISLVPPVHLCLLEASKIRQTLGEVLTLTQGNLGHAMTFVTGASRTSDIELTLAIGVHGPGELHVIVLADR
ncbi:MAG TPA: lactate utilization protein [Pyrinomonadaceae bacterium]|nr:lactate utilization protein [Pyrinomonadaceae bacterium]